MRHVSPVLFLSLILTGCSGSSLRRETKMYAAGEKAAVDRLTYTIIDTEIQPRLGEDPNPRIPQNRFFLVQLGISNGGNEDASIPSLNLIDDSGKVYPELADGTGVQRWIGVVRRVGPGQTEQGYVVFDAPAGHYKLRLSDESSDAEVFADIPLNFAHEQMNNASGPDAGGGPIVIRTPEPRAAPDKSPKKK